MDFSSQFTWSGNRLWRKNRRVNSGSRCLGVDLNRNYNDHWGQVSSLLNLPKSHSHTMLSPNLILPPSLSLREGAPVTPAVISTVVQVQSLNQRQRPLRTTSSKPSLP